MSGSQTEGLTEPGQRQGTNHNTDLSKLAAQGLRIRKLHRIEVQQRELEHPRVGTNHRGGPLELTLVDGNIVTCAQVHLPIGGYTCENTRDLERVDVEIRPGLTMKLPKLPCGCVVFGGMAIGPQPGATIGQQIDDAMKAINARAKAGLSFHANSHRH